ncbi:hypothetical protein [Haloarcula laminariae]|uniref:hypothetical protein n=1 Tax=Haloarcula laminariae TaxID=2961577 RepID=UPI0024064B3B|nr:hypothetical protein [Halomicroarcula sp. FL173]
MKPVNYVWTASQFEGQLVDTLPEDHYFVTGTVTEPGECYYTVPVDQERECMHLCMDATVGYDLSVFAGQGIEAMQNAKFPVWSTVAVPKAYLSDTALDAVSDE